MESQIEQFIQERVYIKSVTPATVRWYRNAFKAFGGAIDCLENVKIRIAELRKRGLSPTSVNVHLRVLKAFYRWHGQLWNIPRLKEEQKILATLSFEQVQRIVRFKAKGINLTRAHLLALLLLDTGLRFAEALNLRWQDVDLDNLLVKVKGKGGKHRVVPISFEGRKALFKWKQKSKFDHVFATRNGTLPTQRNMGRDFALLGERAGIQGVRFSPHTFRHTFAVSYLRAGGNVLYLQRILGHSTLEMTSRYTRSLGTEDLQKVHDRLSLLCRRG